MTNTKPLTAKMLHILKELAKPGNSAIYMKYMGRFNPNPYYFLRSNHDKCTSQVRALFDRGLVERFQEDKFGGHEVRITQAGRDLLRGKS